MRGWFDAFRHDGGPTLYDRANRTAVTGDVPTITFCVIFITLFVAFLIIFPGIRKERFTTFTSVSLSLFVGAVILVGNYGSEWHTTQQQITSAYRAFSSEKIVADLGVHIGFGHVNVSLRSVSVVNGSDRIDYNERFTWQGPDDMVDAFVDALHKGLPYPILTVAEYLSLNEEGFCWGKIYRKAGYFSCITLWSSFASWILMNILLITVPRYGAYMMILTGSLMLLTNLIYFVMIPNEPLVIRFEDVMVTFSFGWCFWLVLIAGSLCILMGIIVALVEVAFPHKFSTIMELDYDTPYDRHIIIEESKDTKHKRPRLEEPIGTFGSKILRRLSKRQSHGSVRGANPEDLANEKFGIDNPSMELDPPKSPWRYPHRTFSNQLQQQQQQQQQTNHQPMRPSSRSESRKSTKSVNFRDVNIYGNTLHPSSAAIISPPACVTTTEDGDIVQIIPDVGHPESDSQWDLDSVPMGCSASSGSSSTSSSDSEEDQEVERVGNTILPVTVINFQSQFRPNSSIISRQNSDDWNNEPDVLVVKSPLHKTCSTQSRQSSTGTPTTKRIIVASSIEDSANNYSDIQLERAGSRRSALATVSARISAAMDADRSSRNSVADQSAKVDLW